MAEYTIRGANYYLNSAIGTIRITPNQRPSFDPQGITKITFLPHTFQASYESGDWSSGVIVRVENLKNSYFRREVLKVLNLNEVLTNVYSGYSNGAVTIEYEERQVEWRRESETHYTEPTQTTRYDDSIYPSESYTEQGVRGRRIVSWEAEYVNGSATGNRRNEQTQTLVDMRPTVRVVGTKRDRIEWRTQSHTESITATQTERRDPNVYPEDSYVQQGRDGQKRVTYERKYVNGEQTEETRNRRESTIRDMQPYVRVIGTKQRARYLVPRIIFNGKHAVKVVRDNQVIRSLGDIEATPQPSIHTVKMLITPFIVRILGHQNEIRNARSITIAGVEIQARELNYFGSDATIIRDRTLAQKLVDAIGTGEQTAEIMINT